MSDQVELLIPRSSPSGGSDSKLSGGIWSGAVRARRAGRSGSVVGGDDRTQLGKAAPSGDGDEAKRGELAAPQFINWVRCLTSSLRARSTPRAACCSTLLIATKRMPGRPGAAQIAAKSRASVLSRLT